jgi:putative FmdB family regulatory protein
MPLYSFKCSNEKCQEQFDEKVSLTELDTKEIKCPKCESKAERLFVGPKISHTSWAFWRR